MKIFALHFALLALFLLAPHESAAHGYLQQPPGRANGSPTQDYQFCLDPPGCECGKFPEAGPIVASYRAGDSINVTLNITLAHPAGDFFHFQLCDPEALSEDCFATGTIASFENDGTEGTKSFQFQIPPDTQCNPCVLRWKWDYGFLSCADVNIEASGTPLGDPSWSVLKTSYR